MSKFGFLAVLALMAALTFFVPFDRKVMPLLVRAATNSATVGVTGNSVLSHASKCDQDTRSIPGMLASAIGRPVLDLSFPGQSLTEAVNLAAVALRNPHIQTVIFPLSVFELLDWDTDPIRNYLVFKLLNPGLGGANLIERVQSPDRFSGTSRRLLRAFAYGGRNYPVYEKVNVQYYVPERDAMPCPENDGLNLDFVAANFNHSYLEFAVLQRDVDLVSKLGQVAAARGKALVIVMLPIDYALMDKLAIPGVDALRGKVAHLVQAFGAEGVAVADLSAGFPDDSFADRWCACGHLLQAGRLAVADGVAALLPGRAAVSR